MTVLSSNPATTDAACCPICNGRTVPHCHKHVRDVDWSIVRCTTCGHGFVSNRPDIKHLIQENASAASAPRPEASVQTLGCHRDALLLTRTVSRLTTLRKGSMDVGCGNGAFSYHLHQAGFTGPHVMLDLDPRIERYAALVPESKFHCGAFESYPPPESGLACVVLSQVLEHVLDPIDWLRRCRAQLAPGGIVAVCVPNFAGLYRLLGARDPFLIPPVHINFFSPQSLSRAMRAAGLKVLRIDSANFLNLRASHGLKLALLKAWNTLAAPLLNHWRRGIVLRVFATPDPEAAAPTKSAPVTA
ncbi:MAG: class I SAM-dependent methyltransferase [Phycisphaeraceae bacterium]|nr:class I SAM-dependent methyltransferase [Phycisphaeraceae bacterium]